MNGHADNKTTRKCVLCDSDAHQSRDIATPDDEVVLTADLCEDHIDKLKRYNNGEGVEFNV